MKTNKIETNHKQDMKRHKEVVKEYRRNNKYLQHAWDKARRGKGKVEIKGLCQMCKKNEAVLRHHEDYNKERDVLLLCQKCHKEIHCQQVSKLDCLDSLADTYSQEEARVKLNSNHNPKVELPDMLKHLAELRKGCKSDYLDEGGSVAYCGEFGKVFPKTYCPTCQAKLQEAQVMLKFQEQDLEKEIKDWKWVELTANEERIKIVGNKILEQKQAQLKLIKGELEKLRHCFLICLMI